MRNVLMILLAICIVQGAIGQSKKNQRIANEQTEAWRYEVTPTGTVSAQGTCVFKIWSYSKDPRVATEQAKKNAVHAVIFKGVPNTDRVKGFRALVGDPSVEASNQAFFDRFFANGGGYMQYVTNTTTGVVEMGDIIKVSKKEYKVGVTVTVYYEALRKRLQQEGVIQSLNSLF